MTRSTLKIIRDEHSSLAAMLQSMRMLVAKGPDESRRQFFDVLRAMLFYIDEYPERLHHPKESNLLFPKVVRASKKVMGAIDKLERDHQYSEKAARELQHQLLAWELLGPSRREAFEVSFRKYVDFYLEHMHLEESVILPEGTIGRNVKLNRVVVDKGAEIPEGMQIGFNPEEDKKRFYVTDKGITLVTPAMLGKPTHRIR